MTSKIMVITGTSKGIGNYLAKYYVEKGYQVVGCSRSSIDPFSERYEHFCLDIADENAVHGMIKQIKQKYGTIDVLINNAGIASMNHILLTPYSTVKKIFSTNFFGTFLFSREVAKIMIKRKYGRIVNFATVATPLNLEGESIYAASKAAIETFTKIMAKETAELGITVNAIGPTPVKTDLIKGVSKEKIESLLDLQAIKRMGEYNDITNAINFFIGEQSDFITGQILFLGGVS